MAVIEPHPGWVERSEPPVLSLGAQSSFGQHGQVGWQGWAKQKACAAALPVSTARHEQAFAHLHLLSARIHNRPFRHPQFRNQA